LGIIKKKKKKKRKTLGTPSPNPCSLFEKSEAKTLIENRALRGSRDRVGGGFNGYKLYAFMHVSAGRKMHFARTTDVYAIYLFTQGK